MNMQAILNWLIQNYPWIVPTVACCWVAWKVSRWVKRIDEHITKVDALPCEEHKKAIKEHDANIDKHTELLEANNKMLSIISKWIMKLDPSMIDPINDAQTIYNMMTEKKSPRKLNDKGMKFYNELKGDEFLATHKDILFEVIDNLKPKTAYDVELYALRALQMKSSEDFFNDYKLYVYNLPEIEVTNENGKKQKYEMTLSDVCFILSIPLRDMYLEAHPEIPR